MAAIFLTVIEISRPLFRSTKYTSFAQVPSFSTFCLFARIDYITSFIGALSI